MKNWIKIVSNSINIPRSFMLICFLLSIQLSGQIFIGDESTFHVGEGTKIIGIDSISTQQKVETPVKIYVSAGAKIINLNQSNNIEVVYIQAETDSKPKEFLTAKKKIEDAPSIAVKEEPSPQPKPIKLHSQKGDDTLNFLDFNSSTVVVVVSSSKKNIYAHKTANITLANIHTSFLNFRHTIFFPEDYEDDSQSRAPPVINC